MALNLFLSDSANSNSLRTNFYHAWTERKIQHTVVIASWKLLINNFRIINGMYCTFHALLLNGNQNHNKCKYVKLHTTANYTHWISQVEVDLFSHQSLLLLTTQCTLLPASFFGFLKCLECKTRNDTHKNKAGKMALNRYIAHGSLFMQ